MPYAAPAARLDSAIDPTPVVGCVGLLEDVFVAESERGGGLGSAELLDYSTTKGAIHNFTAGLAQLLAEKGIRVNTVVPGYTETSLVTAISSDPESRAAITIARRSRAHATPLRSATK